MGGDGTKQKVEELNYMLAAVQAACSPLFGLGRTDRVFAFLAAPPHVMSCHGSAHDTSVEERPGRRQSI